MIIGVDTGGTFTDVVAISDDGALIVRKTPSTPADPSEAILEAVQLVSAEPGFQLVHGTTVATNALLQRRGAKTALLTTRGCRDVLEIARQTRAELYSLNPSPRDPLIPRDLRFEVTERLDWRGEVVTPLDLTTVERALDEAIAAGAESLAICFLFSFLQPDHEVKAARIARRRGLSVSVSSEIAPEFREYERTATVCANAFVGPVMSRYVGSLSARLQDAGASRLSVMQSNGGTLRADEAAAVAVKTVLSGPAGGLIAASRIAAEAGFDRNMTFDMGGTSTDVALAIGNPVTVRTGEVAGLPLLTPMLDIHTVGAGGGSIARVDAGGALRVGPQSAGADPGPVAYGRGDDLTVTDANVFLGRLPSAVRLAGAVSLDAERVREKFKAFARAMVVSPENAAEGVIAVVNANMARALRHISTERGYDPADFTLVSFGGAGGLHACELAEALRIPRVLVPRYPGAFSAVGLALADTRREAVRSFFAPAGPDGEEPARAAVSALTVTVARELAEEGFLPREIARLEPCVEMRYVGQSYALKVGYVNSLEACARRFHRVHKSRYGHCDPRSPVEVVAVGVAGAARRSGSPRLSVRLPANPGEPIGEVEARYRGAWIRCWLFERGSLAEGQNLAGPSIIVQEDSTTFLPPQWSARVDRAGNLILQPG